ncbi:uncharacterized protein PHACADRAFT_148445 [Phanerochaete carnosa HHB-10118-sp]|uniref:Uncharacterized protein n=1 Tax=Phanerochaete carnosa (strain HHB-10118-sp) TaxID=650164 RepID=K5VQD4_PHACS|nr:uncharacterized protein PHACADRAFT_148445 [Phanerochaete carnosa HHB-10118-sp]EKM53688.1 hypothetical protein PHACADRAFT_148445 [Phanerochaete carnosa HHB-10118-sp]
MDPRQREILMNVPAHRSGPEMSFEEIRIRDYITAYQTTGHTPQPIPAEPANPAERARLGLPPLWVPYSEVNGVPVPLDMQTMQSIRSASRRSPSDHTAIPEVQVFASAPVLNEVGQPQYMQSIVCQHPFSAFSSEVRVFTRDFPNILTIDQELRYQAYWIGKKYASEDVQSS